MKTTTSGVKYEPCGYCRMYHTYSEEMCRVIANRLVIVSGEATILREKLTLLEDENQRLRYVIEQNVNDSEQTEEGI